VHTTIRRDVRLEGILEIVGRMDRERLGRLDEAVRRRREELDGSVGEEVRPPVSEVLQYRPHADGYLQHEVRRYRRKDGSTKEHGPYWYFRYHEGGRQKTLYLGKTENPEGALARERGGRRPKQ